MASEKKSLSPFMLWFEEAWEGWIRPLGLVAVLGIAFLLYRFDLLGERTAGVLAVLAIVAGAIGLGVVPAWPLTRAPWQRALLVTLSVAALAGTLYPTLHVALPGRLLASAVLTPDKPTATLRSGQAGPYDLAVSGRFKEGNRSEAEVDYTIKVSDNSGGSDEVSGALERKLVTIRSRKGSSSSVQEHSEASHRLPHVVGPQVTIAADLSFEQLESGLTVDLRHGSLPGQLFIILGALALAMALVLDARLVEPKAKAKGQKTAKSYLTACLAVAFVFSIDYPTGATPHALLRPAVASFLLALVVGGLGGWLLGGIARLLFGPKIKKAPATR
jgi:hypothetical protein